MSTITFNSVPTTCTAKFLTGWDNGALRDVASSTPAKIRRIKCILSYIKQFEDQKFLPDFALIYAIQTKQQVDQHNWDEIMPKFGFNIAFVGEKKESQQRHQETGGLHLWVASPKDWMDSCLAYKKELTEELNLLDPPKAIDPKRQLYPTNILTQMKNRGFILENSKQDNTIAMVIKENNDKFWLRLKNFIEVEFGFDVEARSKKDWKNITLRQLRQVMLDWRNELV